MQTKTINLDPQQGKDKEDGSIQSQPSNVPRALPPILPPRSALILGSTQVPSKWMVEVEGYGPYKPVPPPKPLPQQAPVVQGCLTPPPYRMPPYPLFNEPNTSTATPLDGQTVPVSTQQGLHTHSNKFPIEREVVLSSTDKNSKLPILHDYKIRKPPSGVAVASETTAVNQMAAWQTPSTHQQHQGLNAESTAPGYGHPDEGVYRATLHPSEYCATGTTPRQPAWHQEVPPTTTQQQQISVQIESSSVKETNSKDNKNTMSKTYNTIKDIFSGRFKHSSKENDESLKTNDETGLNNVAEELRRSQRNILEETPEQRLYGKARADQLHQYNQHIAAQQHQQQQQQLIMMQAQQYQMKMQQQQYHLVQSRSQEMLVARPDEQMFYQNAYGGAVTPQRSTNNRPGPIGREQPTYPPQPVVPQEVLAKDNRRQSALERRSAQQIERDSQRQKKNCFEARRAASQPQLAFDDEDAAQTELLDSRPQPQAASVRRNSHGTIVDDIPQTVAPDEKDSDDGGFLKRSKEMDTPPLQGVPRKKLEGEIGKIEGVYNVGQRSGKSDDKKNPAGSAASSDYDKPGQSSSTATDSGRGSAAYSSGRRPNGIESLTEESLFQGTQFRNSTAHQDSEWVDVVENELRQILEPKLHELSLQGNGNITNSTLSESASSLTPPLPPISPEESPNATPRNSTRCKHSSLPYGTKPDYESYAKKSLKFHNDSLANSRWHNGGIQKHKAKKLDGSSATTKQIFGPDTTDLTSTTTRSLDLESMLDAQSDSEGDDISTTDARAIRKQLEGLETMYSEVLKLLGVKKYPGRYQQAEPRFSKRRYGSMSSLPSSSVSSRPIRDKRRAANEDRKKVRDIRGINKRFQRLESHVVTLARSVAHLSSEMRTQHLMIQEMESIRSEIAALRTHTNMMNVRSQSTSRAVTAKELPNLANPTRVKKLTKFFGDEPPLLRLFLRKLGYEKYATIFENERIGMVELPYMSEERLQKMGVPLGPRLRIMQEAQISVSKENTLCIV